MDTNRFDALTRELSADRSRRVLLRAFHGSVVAFAGVASVGIPPVDARKRKGKKKKKKCTGGEKRCGKQCRDLQSDAGNCGRCNVACAADEACVNGVCTCPAGQADCGAGCIDIISDELNCGACGNVCANGTCVHGTCACITDDDCPEGCFSCISRLQGGKACLGGFEAEGECGSDEECQVGGFCATGFATRCSTPCGG